jgi:hypothetical protein
MPTIDWTPVTSGLTNITGTPEYRVEADGLVRWRGALTGIVAANSQFSFPVAARPVTGELTPMYVEWAAGQRSLLIQANNMYVGYNGGISALNLHPLHYQGVAPPVTTGRSLNDVLDALAAALEPIEGLRVYNHPADQVAPPAAIVGLPETPFGIDMGGTNSWEVPVWVVVGRVSDRVSRTLLANYVTPEGDTSVKAAIESDPTLGGACDSVAVTGASFSTISVAGTEYLAAEFTAEVVG